jgi:hypothetical protein
LYLGMVEAVNPGILHFSHPIFHYIHMALNSRYMYLYGKKCK